MVSLSPLPLRKLSTKHVIQLCWLGMRFCDDWIFIFLFLSCSFSIHVFLSYYKDVYIPDVLWIEVRYKWINLLLLLLSIRTNLRTTCLKKNEVKGWILPRMCLYVNHLPFTSLKSYFNLKELLAARKIWSMSQEEERLDSEQKNPGVCTLSGSNTSRHATDICHLPLTSVNNQACLLLIPDASTLTGESNHRKIMPSWTFRKLSW